MAITKQDIHAAADQIAADGGSPTLAAVRRVLGGGSFTTISEAMQEWKAARQNAAAPIREAAPAVVTERMADAANEVWAIAQEMANARLQAEREALEQARAEMEQARAEAAELADQLNAELEAAQATIEQQAESLKQSEQQALTAAAALAESRARVEQLSGLLEQERSDRVKAQAERDDAREQAARFAGQLEALQRQQDKAEAAEKATTAPKGKGGE